MKKSVLIDGNSLLNRAFYATPVFTDSEGRPTNAIFGFIKLVFKIMSDIKPDFMVVAFDMKAPTFRHKAYEAYKATRKPMPAELAMQLEPLKKLLGAMRIAVCEKEGIEADDILGTLSKKFDSHNYIYTGDRDSYQLVDDKTEVYFTKRGVADLLKLNKINFTAETGLSEPSQVIDLKALMGDSSDNIPGVAGIGEKTARGLLEKYGTLDGVYSHISEIKGAVQAKLLQNKETAYLSYSLAKIDRDCEIDLKLEDCTVSGKYGIEVKKLFRAFEFKSLLGLNIFDDEATGGENTVVYPELINCNTTDNFFKVFSGVKEFSAVITEAKTEVYAGGKQYNFAVSEDLFVESGVTFEALSELNKKLFDNPDRTAIVFDAKGIMHELAKSDIKFLSNFEDLQLLNYLCEHETASFSFKELCSFYGYDYKFSAFALDRLYRVLLERAKQENLLKLYREIEKPLVQVLYRMECEGVKISLDIMNELSTQFGIKIEEYKNKIYELCGKQFNINSPMQLGDVLYNNLGITEVKKKKSDKYVTGADVLEKIAEKYPVVNDVLKYRFYQKLMSTYIDGFRPLIDKKSGIIHTTFHQTATSTGRLSSSNPNLQNIPVRDDEGKELRKLFVAREGNMLIDADYSQIELRLLAHFSECKELIEAYRNATDIHAVTASQVFGVPIDEVTQKMRRAAKAVNFGIIYGISEFGLAKNLNITKATAREYIDKYFENYSAVKSYMQKNVDFAREHGYVCTLTGRKRVIHEINSSNYNLRQFGERAAMNMPLQGSSADIIKIAMVNVDSVLKAEGLKTRIILQVHDELILEAPEAEVKRASEILKEKMETAVELKVPLTVDVHTGKNWYDAK